MSPFTPQASSTKNINSKDDSRSNRSNTKLTASPNLAALRSFPSQEYKLPEVDHVEYDQMESSSSEEYEQNVGSGKTYAELLSSLTANSTTSTQSSRPRKRQKLESDVALSTSLSEDHDSSTDNSSHEEVQDAFTQDADEDELMDQSDPFESHFADERQSNLMQNVTSLKESKWNATRKMGRDHWRCTSQYPGDLEHAADPPVSNHQIKIEDLYLKKKLQEIAKLMTPPLNSLISHFAEKIFHYQDILFPLRTLQNADLLRKLTCTHCLNHILKTRDKVIKNNARFSKERSDVDFEARDQGFTRPKVLILLPTRQSCARYVETLVSLYGPEQQENRKRFQDSFSSIDSNLSHDKPDDFRELFAGNDDDLFRLGIKLTRKTVKFFSKFYNSDIIIASPLGLRMAIDAGDTSKYDTDFLSSIEILLMDQADSIFMQNWEHIEYIIERMNLQPKEAHGCDFSRVQNWYLDGNARFVRQTLMFSSFNFPALNKVYVTGMLNYSGKSKYFIHEVGVMAGMRIMPKQTFSRYRPSNVLSEPDARFDYFTRAVLPLITKIKKSAQDSLGMLIFVPLYTDFLRIRNYIASTSATQNITFGAISEYMDVKNVARSRSHFQTGQYSALLYTERAHHFRRYHIKGVKRIVMYGLPENPTFYKEMVEGFIGASVASGKQTLHEADVRVIFSRLDILKLERIVGSERYLGMLKENAGDMFDFTG